MAQAALSDQEEMCTNFSFPSHGNKILQSLNKQRLDSSLCDVTITVQGQQYKAHKSVLAAYSPYFHGMFTVNWLSSEGDLVMELDGVTSRAFDSLLKLIYTSVLTVSPAIISEVVSAATYLDMPDVVAVCNQYMDKNLALKTAAARKDYSTGPAGLEVGDSDDDDDVDTEPAIFANAEDDWTVNLQDISSAARTGEAGMKPAGAEETVSEPPKPKKKRRWKDEHGSFQCETCGKLYTSRASYRQHMYGHRSGKKHTCMAARPKGVKAVVKLKKKKEKKWRSRTLDPVDGSKVACTCGAFPGYDKEYWDRCGSGRCPCYRQYKTCGPKCICKHCINVVAVAKPAEVDPAKTCSCGKNDKKKGASVVRCSMNVRCACFKSSRPCGRYCRCVNCGNKGDGLNTTEQGPPNGEASLVKKDIKTPKLFAKPPDRRKVRAMKGSVAEMLGKMRTSGTTFQKGSSERNTASRESTTGKEGQARRAEKSISGQISKSAEEQAMVAGQDARNRTNTRTIDTTAAEVASAVASIQAQADTVNPLPAGHVPLIHSQAPAAPKDLSAQGKGCICGKGDKKLGEKSSVQRCSLNLKCSCFKEGRPCGSHCNCFNCGNRAGISDSSAPTNGDTGLVKEGLKPKLFRKQQEADRNVGARGSKVAKGSVKAMLAKMRTPGATGQKDSSKNTTKSATEVASAVAGIQSSSQVPAESVVRPLPAVPIPVLPSQAPATLGGTLKWVCLPDGSVVSPVKVTGTVRFVGSSNNNATALPSNSGSQPPAANTDSQHAQKTSEANDKSRKEQTVDQDAMDVENTSPGAGNVSSDDEGMDQGSPTLDQNTETEGDKEASLDKGPKESTAEESRPEDRRQSSGPKRRQKKTVRAGTKRPSPTQSLQPTIVLRRLNLRSGRVNVKEIETMEENASNKTSTPSKSSASVGATSVDTRESGDSELHPSKKLKKGKAPKATKRPRKSKPQKMRQLAAKEAATEAGPESEADAATHGAQDDASTWSSRLRKDRKRTWKSSSAEWIGDDSGGELSDDSLEKDYTADSDVSSSDEEDVAAIEEEEEDEEKRLERRKKVLKRMQGSGKKKVKQNTIGDLLDKGENPKKSLKEAVLEQEGRQGRPRKTKATTVRSRLKKATPIRELLKLKSPEQGPKEIPSWLEEWKKSLSPGTKHTPGGKGDANKTAEGGEGGTSTVSVQGSSSTVSVGQSTQAPASGGPSTQDRVTSHSGTGDGQSTAQLQTVSIGQSDQAQASGGPSTQDHGVPLAVTGDGQRTAHLQAVSVQQSGQALASGGPSISTQDQIAPHSGMGDGQSTAHQQAVSVGQRDQT
ncbi:uncharacterized protein LOC144910265 isoform X1 [Branchiostoma floridae x Branchiostoma belcheri]